MKEYNFQRNIGNAKYVVNFHDGEKVHKDGSKFYDIKIFKNLKLLNKFIISLVNKGYIELS